MKPATTWLAYVRREALRIVAFSRSSNPGILSTDPIVGDVDELARCAATIDRDKRM